MNQKQIFSREFGYLKRKLKLNPKITRLNFRGERTIIVLSGLSFEPEHLKTIKGLSYYEERLLFFLFLLRYKRTKIIYLTSRKINPYLVDYYLDIISHSEEEKDEMKSRLVNIYVDDDRLIPLTKKFLEKPKLLRLIKKNIGDTKKAYIRCYSSTLLERIFSLKLDIPLFAVDLKLTGYGDKSGSRKIFKEAGTKVIPGYENLKTTSEVFMAIAMLIKNYPSADRIIVKLEKSAAGRGNCVFQVGKFKERNNLEISVETNIAKLSGLIKKQFCDFSRFQYQIECSDYLKKFNRIGGIVEIFITGERASSPCIRMEIDLGGKLLTLSNHEQILGGPDKQNWLGCYFPIKDEEIRLGSIREARKIRQVLAKKGVIGTFNVDFVVIFKKGQSAPIIYPVEINLRKGGTTHPFMIVRFVTGAKYDKSEGQLYVGSTPIYYRAYDIIEDDKYRKITSNQLINLVKKSKIGFMKNKNKGVIIYMPGAITKYGKFGAVCIGNTHHEAQLYYKKLLKLIDDYVTSL